MLPVTCSGVKCTAPSVLISAVSPAIGLRRPGARKTCDEDAARPKPLGPSRCHCPRPRSGHTGVELCGDDTPSSAAKHSRPLVRVHRTARSSWHTPPPGRESCHWRQRARAAHRCHTFSAGEMLRLAVQRGSLRRPSREGSRRRSGTRVFQKGAGCACGKRRHGDGRQGDG